MGSYMVRDEDSQAACLKLIVHHAREKLDGLNLYSQEELNAFDTSYNELKLRGRTGPIKGLPKATPILGGCYAMTFKIPRLDWEKKLLVLP
ncbi:MAG: hypothetical protein LUG50_13390 [Planctomycetaceae bacterium]|nr:hypothetical protein [Planctomycetaceae bacterium]